MNTTLEETLRTRVRNLESMPAMPAILGPLPRSLELPPDQIEIEKVTELISPEKSIAAQYLRMANSALFSHRGTKTVRGAVITLGARRLRDTLWSSFLIRLSPHGNWPINPTTFWEHSFGCALVSQRLAKKDCSARSREGVTLRVAAHADGQTSNVVVQFESGLVPAHRIETHVFPLRSEGQIVGRASGFHRGESVAG